MKIDVLDLKGKTIEELNLDKGIFGVEPNTELVNQYIRVYRSNQRQGTSSTKTRGEVSGGGKKPWKQKGTGRARVGSSRNPIWRHGGISHGPKPKDWSLAFPKRMKVVALKSALSLKYASNKLLVLDELKMSEPKAKVLAGILKDLNVKGKTLIVMDTVNSAVIKSAANLKNVKVSLAANLNGYEVLDSNKTVFVKTAVKNLETKYKAK